MASRCRKKSITFIVYVSSVAHARMMKTVATADQERPNELKLKHQKISRVDGSREYRREAIPSDKNASWKDKKTKAEYVKKRRQSNANAGTMQNDQCAPMTP